MILSYLYVFILLVFAAAYLMLGAAVIHSWWSLIPTMSFSQAFFIASWISIPFVIYLIAKLSKS
jgi:hypothetical protein